MARRTVVSIDGEIFEPEHAKISIFDRGFLYGDSIYEVLRTVAGRPRWLDEHLARLERSAEGIGLVLPRSRAEMAGLVEQAIRATGHDECYVRIVVTRGGGELDLDPARAVDPACIVIAKPLRLPPEDLYRSGAPIVVVGVRRNLRQAVDPSVKSGNYLNNILALAEARRGGAYEAVMCDRDGFVAEGSTSNMFAVQAGMVWTPPLETGILDGITRAKVIEICAHEGIPVREQPMRPDDLRGADEAFLTASIRGVMPIRSVDGRAVGAVCPGPTTARLMALYAGRLATG
jgi:branched-chain amino acid aminotransferase